MHTPFSFTHAARVLGVLTCVIQSPQKPRHPLGLIVRHPSDPRFVPRTCVWKDDVFVCVSHYSVAGPKNGW